MVVEAGAVTDSAETTETTEFDTWRPIYESALWLTDDGLHYLSEKVGALAKRARRLKVAEPTVSVYRSITVATKRLGDRVWIPVEALPGRPASVTLRHFVGVAGEGPKLPDWRLVAVLAHDEGVTLVRGVPGAGEVPVKFRERGPNWCDHCRTKRRRTDTFVVLNKSGEFRSVGRTCLRDFLGNVDPKRLLSLARLMLDLADEAREAESLGWGGGYAPPAYDPLAVLSATSMIVREFGWTSRGKARDYGYAASADRAIEFINGPPSHAAAAKRWREEYGDKAVTDADVKRGEAALAWGKALGDDGATLGDYLYNAKTVAGMGVWRYRQIGIGASVLTAWDRAMGRELEYKRAAKAKAESKHFGAIGERIEFTATLVFHTSWEGDYGVTHLYKFETDAGGMAVWFASRDFDMERGWTYKLRATVKKHDNYKGTAQTHVNRGKVLETIGEPAA